MKNKARGRGMWGWGRSVLPCAAAAIVVACSGGDPVARTEGTDSTGGCNGSCAGSTTSLTIADVQLVIAQGVAEAQARGVNATIAVVDRVGNVLAVYRMGNPAGRFVTITTTPGSATISGGLENLRLPAALLDQLAAIAKAVTGAYLSSEGNAFSSRTASQIVQEHFNPGEQFQPSGPLFGVQFSQLACSDLINRFDGVGPSFGPQRSPLGLSADPGGFPLYKSGTVVGGVGVIADDFYTIDEDIADSDDDTDEAIAYAATFNFAAPVDRRADRITADGKTLRFSDVDFDQLRANPASAPAFGTIAPTVGALLLVPGYSDGTVKAGTSFGQAASGIRADGDVDYPGRDAFVLVDSANLLRYPPIAGTDGGLLGPAVLTQNEVRTILQSALDVANHARAQIRRPLGSQARVTISVVDTSGAILGIARTRDAPLFGTDVSLQKARTAAFMSSSTAAPFLAALPNAKYITVDPTPTVTREITIGDYVTALRTFLGNSIALGDGRIAYTDRANGNLSRPFFPDGIDGESAGPLSKPAGEWSPFSTGLQLDVTINAILQHVLFVAGAVPDVAPGCAGVQIANDFSSIGQTLPPTNVRLGNGLQIFPGSVPIFRGGTLVGAIGVSGDGVDQDDMIAFLGLHNAGEALGSGLGNAPADRRADTVIAQGVRLRYVQCPQSPFIDNTDDNVCEGK